MEKNELNYRKPLQVKPVERLSISQIEAVHRASMRLLSETGITCAGKEAAGVYRRNGCSVEEAGEGSKKKHRVCFPVRLLEETLKKVPSEVILGARDPKNTLLLDARKPAVYFGTGAETNVYLKSRMEHFVQADGGRETMQYPVFSEEPGSIAALSESAHLIEQLDNADFFIRNVNIQDKEIIPSNKDVNVFYASLLNTTKHVQGGLTDLGALSSVIKMAKIAGGDQDHLPLSFIVCPIKSPLQMVADSSEKVIAIARHRVPMVISSSPQGGSTAPIQEEGIITQINAEILAGIALAQFAQSGTPVIYGSVPVRTRLDTLHDCYGAPEFIHYAMGCAQMARFYGIPCYTSAGVGDAKRPGMQAMIEKVFSYMGVASTGAHYIHYAFGLLAGTNIFSPLQAVLDNAAVHLVKDILRIPTCDEKSIEAAVYEIQSTSAKSGIFVKGIRKQLRKKAVSDTYEFLSDNTDDQVFVQAQQKLEQYLANESKGLPKQMVQTIYDRIPGLVDIQPCTVKGGS